MVRPGRKRREQLGYEDGNKPNRPAAKRTTPRKPESRLETRASEDAVAGRNSVVEALRAKIPAKELMVAERVEMDERMTEALRLAKNQGLTIKEVPRGQLDGVTGTTNHQGVALIIKPFQYKEFEAIIKGAKKPGLIIGLDGVTDPHNLGAIVRSAAAFNADGVVIPERRNATMTGSAWKSSAGAAARLPICQVTNLVRSIEDAKKEGYFVVGLDAEGQENLPAFSLAKESVYLIVGSEGKGLSRLTREKCDLILSIPMQSDVESLNASVATAITLYKIAEIRGA
jgi:23S rRNA (guanosine2251-2'-O)-methyltransferase